MIHTREELLNALDDAAELEHSLACQYQFTAFTLKQEPAEGISEAQKAKVDSWKEDHLFIARQEMSHLATVCNLLAVIGGAPRFRRPNFPQKPGYYPPDIAFSLEKFSEPALDRYIKFEKPPAGARPLIAPEILRYDGVGGLYRKIREGFETLDEATLFLRKDSPQDTTEWGGDVAPMEVRDRASALLAIDRIVEEGEGTTRDGERSHFHIFTRIKAELLEERAKDPGFEPARNVVSDPLTRRHRDTPGTTLIEDETTRDYAELFNVVYGTLILLLAQYYAFAAESPLQRQALRRSAVLLMRRAIRPLGELLTRMPMGPSYPGQFAGPSFEFYGDLQLSAEVKASWSIILERLVQEVAEADRLAKLEKAPAGMKYVVSGIEDVRGRLAAALGA